MLAPLPDRLVTLDDARGMASLLDLLGPRSPALRAAHAILASTERLLLCTGFPVGEASETDGPAGAIALARALSALCRPYVVVSWDAALDAWADALGDLPAVAIARGGAPERLMGNAVTIEVCGRTAAGAYLNMRGDDVRGAAPWFEDAVGMHALVSVGDGGNEFGMGSAPPAWFEGRGVVPPVSTCDALVVGQVSNWAVLAIIACLSRLTAKALLPEPTEYQEILNRLADRGVVDGVDGTARPTEDGHDLGRAEPLIAALRRWAIE